MAQPRQVQPTNEVRQSLNKITARFDEQGADAEPIVFGSHRRPQAVLLSWDAWMRLLDRLPKDKEQPR